jgi:hypothetical protein
MTQMYMTPDNLHPAIVVRHIRSSAPTNSRNVARSSKTALLLAKEAEHALHLAGTSFITSAVRRFLVRTSAIAVDGQESR